MPFRGLGVVKFFATFSDSKCSLHIRQSPPEFRTSAKNVPNNPAGWSNRHRKIPMNRRESDLLSILSRILGRGRWQSALNRTSGPTLDFSTSVEILLQCPMFACQDPDPPMSNRRRRSPRGLDQSHIEVSGCSISKECEQLVKHAPMYGILPQ